MNKRIENQVDENGDGTREVARFGEARLVIWEGILRLEGGTMADRMEALEWAAMVCPELRVQYDERKTG